MNINGSVVEITLANGGVAIVDNEDAEAVLSRKWFVGKVGYAVANVKREGIWTQVYMHREILKPQRGQMVDHINGNPLDNRRCNLRLASKSQNAMNRGAPVHNKSGFKGVCWNSKSRSWRADCSVGGTTHTVSGFSTPADAARAYNEMALKMHGEFAKLNVISGHSMAHD